MAKQKKNAKHGRYIVKSYSVIEFMDEECGDRLFETIPDSWFNDETKQLCFWPPNYGTKSFSLRAINCEKPDDTWGVCECKVVSEGHLTYASGFKFLQKKISQKYNTSSADDQIDHRPVMVVQGDGSIESVFSEKNSSDVIIDRNMGGNGSENQMKNTNRRVAAKKMGANAGVVDSKEKNELTSQSASGHIATNKNQNKQQDVTKPSSPKNFDLNAQIKSVAENNSTEVADRSRSSSSHRSRSTSHRSRSSSHHSQSSSDSSRKSSNRQPSLGHRSRSSSKSSRSSSHRSRNSSNSFRSLGHRSRSSSRISRSSSNISRSSRSSSHRSRNSSDSFRSSSHRSIRSHCRRSKSNSLEHRLNLKYTSQAASGQSASGQHGKNKNQQQEVGRRSSKKNLNLASGVKVYEAFKNKSSKRAMDALSMSNIHKPLSKSNKTLTTPCNTEVVGSSHSNTRTIQSEIRRSNENKTVKNNTYNGSITSHSAVRRSHSRRSRSISRQSQSRRSRSHSHSNRTGRSEVRRSGSQSSFRGSEDFRSDVKQIKKFLEKIDQRQMEHERRLNRIEVTINKTFIVVGDLTLTNTNNLRFQHNGSSNRRMDIESEAEIDDFDAPKLPIWDLSELDTLQKELKNQQFRKLLIKHQRDFCTPSKLATNTVTLTKYLKRFISLHVRCKITLKEKTKNESGDTLMGDYHRVYLFLIDVMRAGYQTVNKQITVEEAHTALRTVWSRSKQLKNEEDQKKRKLKLKRINEKSRRH